MAYFFLVHGVYTINAVDGSYTLFLQRKLIEIGQGSHLTLPNDLYVFVVMCLFSTGEFQFKLQFQNRINMISWVVFYLTYDIDIAILSVCPSGIVRYSVETT